MHIDNRHYCDWCCVDLSTTQQINALFGVVLCSDCDNGVKRRNPPKIPMHANLRRYLRRVECGEISPPWSHASMRDKDGNLVTVPVPLTLDGKPKKSRR